MVFSTRNKVENEAHTLAPVSTCVTRSIGDWDGSRALVPEPELMAFKVAPHEFVRVVIASDGLWDFVSHVEAAKVVRKSYSSTRAAERLVQLACNRSLSSRGRLKDDTTVIVVDLNPSSHSSWPALATKRRAPMGLFGCMAGKPQAVLSPEPVIRRISDEELSKGAMHDVQ